MNIGLSEDMAGLKGIDLEVILQEDVCRMLPERPLVSHKGTYGTVTVVAGSVNYTGAAYLASKAAYRIGAGLVQTAVPGPLYQVLAGQLPEAIWLVLPDEMGVIHQKGAALVRENLERTSALLLGPGWGIEETTSTFLKNLLDTKPSKAKHGGIGFVDCKGESVDKAEISLPPLVIDADGLKLLKHSPTGSICCHLESILTPHPGEMAVLSGLPISEIQGGTGSAGGGIFP